MTEAKESRILALFSRPIVIIPLLLFLVAISYANTLYSPLVLDDIHSFVEEPNVYINDLSYESFTKLTQTHSGKARVIPVATFSLNHYMGKGKMPHYHITNIIIHLLNTLVVYWLVMTLLRTPIGSSALRGISKIHFAFFVAALWSLNPVQTNGVTYIVQRMTSISTLFFLAALALYVKGRLADKRKQSGMFFMLSAVMTLCAFHSKENSYMLPVVILLVEWVFISPGLFRKVFQKIKWFHWAVIAVLGIVALPLLEYRLVDILSAYNNIRPFSLAERLLTEARIVVYYISLLLLPLPGRLNFDYDFSLSTSFFSPPNTFGALFLIGIVLFWSLRNRKQYPLIAFGVFWYFLNLLIESSVIPLELIFEHRLYLPSLGIWIACLATLDIFISYLKTKHPAIDFEQLFILVMVFVATMFSIGTTFRNHVWQDSYTLYSDCVKKSPDKPRVYLNQGVAMGRDRNLERESIAVFEKAIALGKPKRESYVQAVNNIVVAYSSLGEYEEAITVGEKYIKDAPSYISGQGFPRFMYNLAYANKKLGYYSEAMHNAVSGFTKEKKKLNGYLVDMMTEILTEAYDHEEFRKKLELTDEDGEKYRSVRLRMARLLSDLRDYEKANDFLQPVVKAYPEHELAKDLNSSIQERLQKNRYHEERMKLNNHPPYNEKWSYKTALDLSDFILKSYSPLTDTVGWLLDQAEKASQFDDPFVLWYRIKWYMKTLDGGKLVAALEEAARLQPDFIPILRLTGEYYELVGEQEKAVNIFSHIIESYPGEPLRLIYERKVARYKKNKEI